MLANSLKKKSFYLCRPITFSDFIYFFVSNYEMFKKCNRKITKNNVDLD